MRSQICLALVTVAVALSACEQPTTIVRPPQTDVFFQDPPTEVDILLVVDNSCSMEDEQSKLSEGFADFVRFFEVAEVDYHVGVTTTDMFNTGPGLSGELARASSGDRVIDEDTANADDVFSELVRVGIEGSGSEQGIEAALVALSDDSLLEGPNAGFLREDALLTVIFVSDEEDYSVGPVNGYINALREVKGQRSRDAFNASALIGVDEDTGEPAPCGGIGGTGAGAAYRYHDVALQTGGVLGSICADEFNDIVEEMGLASSRLRERFFLTREADPETLEIRVHIPGTDDFDGEGTVVPPEGLEDGAYAWEYSADVETATWLIAFTDRSQLPPLGSKIVARYEVP